MEEITLQERYDILINDIQICVEEEKETESISELILKSKERLASCDALIKEAESEIRCNDVVQDTLGECYLVARKAGLSNSFVVKSDGDVALNYLIAYLTERTREIGVEITTVASIEEDEIYSPYKYLNSERIL